jgi:hypothetical protein
MSEAVSERQIWSAAVHLVRAYGGGATDFALQMASRFEPTQPSNEAETVDYAIWLGVARAANELLKPEPDFGEWIQ